MLDDAIYQHIDTEDYRTRLCSRIAKIDQENEFHSMQLKTTISVYKASLSFFSYPSKLSLRWFTF